MEIENWLKVFMSGLGRLFGSRLFFLGLQGSYARGEQSAESDIDVVVILAEIRFEDLEVYRNFLDSLPERGKICGFVGGRNDLMNWEKSDLIQLYLDTQPLAGSLDFLSSLFSEEDIRRSVLTGACNVYHACSHNFLHARDIGMLRELFKSARFVVRMKHYLETGLYISRMRVLEDNVSGKDLEVLKIANSASISDFQLVTESETGEVPVSGLNFRYCSRLLIEWAGEVMASAKF